MIGQSVHLASLLMIHQIDDTPEHHAAIQRDLKQERFENVMRFLLAQFNKWKWKGLHLGRSNPMYQCMLGLTQLEICRKEPEVLGGHQVENELATWPCHEDG